MIKFKYVLEKEFDGQWDEEYRPTGDGMVELPFRPQTGDQIEVEEGWARVRSGVRFPREGLPGIHLVLLENS